MPKTTALYFHGLGSTELRPKERMLLEANRQKSLEYTAAYIDWCAAETFTKLLDRMTNQARDVLDKLSPEDTLVLEGTSAGGSLSINTYKALDDPRVRVICHSGRLSVGNYSERSWRNLAHCAHLGTNRASQSFYDSVEYCEAITTPSLTDVDKSKIVITMPLADEVVPVSTMTIEGVKTVRVPIVGHSLGIGMGIMRATSLVKDFNT